MAGKAYIEIKQSTEDGLVIKRFKRLPIEPSQTTSLAKLDNTLPIKELQKLSKGQFCWAADPMKHLGPKNHERARNWIKNVLYHMKSSQYCTFLHINYTLDARALPASVKNKLRETSRLPYLSVFLHNHMIAYHKGREFDLEAFRDTGLKLMEKLQQLLDWHHQFYYDRGCIPSYELLRLKPTGPIKIPYADLGVNPLNERLRLKECVETLQFLLAARNGFNQTFPADAFAGMIADVDAMRKDELSPSYIDWPGKYELHMPGAYPEHEMDTKLFDIIKFADFTIDRMWDQWHPSPSKAVKATDYRTPIRKAMQKNILVKDRKGQVKARKGALKPLPTDYEAIERRCALQTAQSADKRIDIEMDADKEGRAAFIGSPVAWYIPSTNTPIQHGNSKHKAPMTPSPPKLDRTVIVEPAEAVERIQEPLLAANLTQAVESPRPVEPTRADDALPTGDVFPTNDGLPTGDGALPAAEGTLPIVTQKLSVTEDIHHTIIGKLPVIDDALSVVAEAPPITNTLGTVAAAPNTTKDASSIADDTLPIVTDAFPAGGRHR